MCKYVKPLATRTKFIILMHPKEFKKIKNGTGHLTHLSLPNSELFIGIDFSTHKQVNALIDDKVNHCVLLYPGESSRVINDAGLGGADNKQHIVFILDATWDCSKKMLRLSHNLAELDRISFTHEKESIFEIKEQPESYCLSTIESVHTVLELLHKNGTECLAETEMGTFLDPFKAMIDYQKSCISTDGMGYKNSIRYKKPGSKA